MFLFKSTRQKIDDLNKELKKVTEEREKLRMTLIESRTQHKNDLEAIERRYKDQTNAVIYGLKKLYAAESEKHKKPTEFMRGLNVAIDTLIKVRDEV